MVSRLTCQVRDLYRNGNLRSACITIRSRAGVGSQHHRWLVKVNDILIAAAEELITTTNPDVAFGATTDCATTALFDAQNKCLADGFACFVGVPLTQDSDQCSASVAGRSAATFRRWTPKRLTAAPWPQPFSLRLGGDDDTRDFPGAGSLPPRFVQAVMTASAVLGLGPTRAFEVPRDGWQRPGAGRAGSAPLGQHRRRHRRFRLVPLPVAGTAGHPPKFRADFCTTARAARR